MNHQPKQMNNSKDIDEQAIRALYQNLLEKWNTRDPAGFAALFTEDCHLVGFDGSMMNGKAEIATSLSQIFADHQTAAYIGKVREVQFLASNVALLRAVAGMVSPGQTDINPAVNTIQTLITVRDPASWAIVLYQNTPAQFHGRPDLTEQLTEELQHTLEESRRA